MKVFSDGAIAALSDGTAIVSGAVAIECDPPVYVWGGWGTLTLAGNEFLGVGDRGLAQITNASLGGSAQAVSLTLSAIDEDTIALLDAEQVRGASAILWRLIFDGSGHTLLDAHVFSRGRIDQLPVDAVIGGEASITATIEGAARSLGRRGGRMRTDADQRLIEATDGGMKHVSYAAAKQLYWGGQRPATAGVAVSGGINGGGFSPRMIDPGY